MKYLLSLLLGALTVLSISYFFFPFQVCQVIGHKAEREIETIWHTVQKSTQKNQDDILLIPDYETVVDGHILVCSRCHLVYWKVEKP